MNSLFKNVVDAPWKLFNEIYMYMIKPFVHSYLLINGVKIGKNAKFYGFPRIMKHRGSKILIGDNFEARCLWFSNPLGVNHPVILCTWQKDAEIEIGDNVGISGGSIVSAKKIKIGNGVLIGANSTIIDTNFHPLNGDMRYSKLNISSSPVSIGSNVFIGMNSIILKGTNLKNDTIVPAGGVIRNG